MYVYGWCGSGTGVEAGKGGGAGDVLKLLTNKPFLLAVLCGGCLQASHAMYYAFGTLSFAAQGYSGGVIGLLWSVGVWVFAAVHTQAGWGCWVALPRWGTLLHL